MTIGQAITNLRHRAKLSIRAAAEAVGVSPQAWQILESDDSNPKMSTLRSIVKILKVSDQDLVALVREKPVSPPRQK